MTATVALACESGGMWRKIQKVLGPAAAHGAECLQRGDMARPRAVVLRPYRRRGQRHPVQHQLLRDGAGGVRAYPVGPLVAAHAASLDGRALTCTGGGAANMPPLHRASDSLL